MWDSERYTEDGFLLDLSSWDSDTAEEVASHIDIELTDQHWMVINGVRSFYSRTGVSPSMRPLIKVVKNEIDPALASTIEMSRLFGNLVSRHVAMLSGLPKPSDCL